MTQPTSPKDPDNLDAEYALTKRMSKYMSPVGKCIVKGYEYLPENVTGVVTHHFGKKYTVVSVFTESHQAHGLSTRSPEDRYNRERGVGTALSRACKELARKFLVRKEKK